MTDNSTSKQNVIEKCLSPNQPELRLDSETPEGDNEEDLTMEQKHGYQGLAIGFTLSYYKEKRLYENKTHGIEILLPEVKIYKEFCEPKVNDYLPDGETRGLVKLRPRLPPGRRDAWTRQIKTAIHQNKKQRRLYTYPDTKDNRSLQRKSSESHE